LRSRSGRALARGAVAVAALVACERGEAPEPADDASLGEARCGELRLDAPPPGASAVIVLNDTMRRDVVGAYGGRARTPELDRFAREGLLFERAASQAPWTKPSVATLFTALYPSQHRVATDPGLRRPGVAASDVAPLETDRLSEGFVTLAEALRAAGLRTAAFVANPWLDSRFGFAQGFDVYDDSFAAWDSSGDAAVDAAIAWLEGLAPGERFFLYLHLIESHRPYGRLGPEGLEALREKANRDQRPTGVDAAELADAILLADGTPASAAGFRPTRTLFRAAYRRGVEKFDALLGRFLDALRASEAWPRTAVLVTSDHGEALYRRGYGNHGMGFFEDETALPLLARLPGVVPERGRVGCLVGLVDLMPSLCDYLGATCPAPLAGWSFLSRPGEPPGSERRYLVTEGIMGRPAHRALRNQRFKLLYEPEGKRGRGDVKDPPWSLYDLEEDPRERLDRVEASHATPTAQRAYAAMRAALPGAVADYAAPAGETAPVSPQLEQRLEALGYLKE
jgi:choline-sulfatase